MTLEKTTGEHSPLSDVQGIDIIYEVQNIIKSIPQLFFNAKIKIDICINYYNLQSYFEFESIKEAIIETKKRGIGIRYLTEITKDNIEYCKELVKIVDEVRHVARLKGNFVISESEFIFLCSISDEEKSKEVASKNIYSNTRSFIEDQQYFFDLLWNNAIPAEKKIKEIEDGISHIRIQVPNEPKIIEIEKIIKSEGIQIIRNPFQVQKLVFELLKLAKDEILVIFSTANAFHRQEKTGALGLLFDIATKNSLNIKIMTPVDDKIKEKKQEIENIEIINEVDDKSVQLEEISKEKHDQKLNSKKIQIRFIESRLQTTISILIVDKKYSLAVELKDDTKDTIYEAIGLSTYSNSKSTVLSYVSMFETLWLQTELCDQLKLQDKIQKEFIDVAAHELRTPIQPIIAITEILYSQNRNDEGNQKLLGVIIRNAKRLNRLTEDILDVAKIEGKSLQIKKERFNLEEVISNLIAQYKTYIKEIYNTINLEFLPEEKDLFIEGDKGRISQVIDNLLCNSIKFTEDVSGGGNITVIAKREDNDRIKVITKDTGIGIDKEILSRLFTKFATKSAKGTGLGLYISKKIIEAHAGEIWGKNNDNGIGAEFGFVLPIRNN